MTFKAAKCPNCAGDIQVPDDRDTVKCMYCGSDIVVREAIKLAGGVNIENLIVLAKTAEQSGKWADANKYYSVIIEHDLSRADVWLWKGICLLSGNLLPDGTDLSLAETCFLKALNLSTEKKDLKQRLIDLIMKKCGAFTRNDTSIWDFPNFINMAGQLSIIHSIDADNPLGLIAKAAKAGLTFDNAEPLYRRALNLTKNEKRAVELISTLCCWNYCGASISKQNVESLISKIRPVLDFLHKINPSDRPMEKWIVSGMCSIYSSAEQTYDRSVKTLGNDHTIFHNLLKEVKRVDPSFKPGKIPRCLKSGWFV